MVKEFFIQDYNVSEIAIKQIFKQKEKQNKKYIQKSKNNIKMKIFFTQKILINLFFLKYTSDIRLN